MVDLQEIKKMAAIMGIPINDIDEDAQAIHDRIESYKVASNMQAIRRSGFIKVCAASTKIDVLN